MVKIKLSTRNFIFTVVHVHQVKTLWLRPWGGGWALHLRRGGVRRALLRRGRREPGLRGHRELRVPGGAGAAEQVLGALLRHAQVAILSADRRRYWISCYIHKFGC